MKYIKGKRIITIMNNENLNKIEEKLKLLPKKPGVYLMKDKHLNIIYVGKAVILKNRVKQYFRKNEKTLRIQKLVENIFDFDYIITDSEEEALILENNYIKKYNPKYNVLLKDDKTYPYIMLDVKNIYPTLSFVRRRKDDGNKYFGPFVSSTIAKEIIEILKEKYKLRYCKDEIFKDLKTKNRKVLNNLYSENKEENEKAIYKILEKNKPCFYSHIGKCDGICRGKVTIEEYDERTKEAAKVLKGNIKDIIKLLENDMQKYSMELEFEKAGEIRDKIESLKKIVVKQKMDNFTYNTIDAIGIFKNEFEISVTILEVRNSKLQNTTKLFMDNTGMLEDEEIIKQFLMQYYIGKSDIPKKIMIRYNFDEILAVSNILSNQCGYKVDIIAPKRGENIGFVNLAEENAKESLKNKYKIKENLLLELKNKLNLKELPRIIESYDISNLGGEDTVASRVVIKEGKIDRRLNRKLKIKSVIGQDDYMSMKEAVTRRINHTLDGKDGYGDLPSLIIVDGGKGQINSAKEAIQILKLNRSDFTKNISVFGLVKDDKHRTKSLIDNKGNEYELSKELMELLVKLQDEIHNVAIKYHRKLRDEKLVKSALDEISGVGKIKKEKLIKEFKSVENIKKLSISDLIKVEGINEKLAIKILENLNKK